MADEGHCDMTLRQVAIFGKNCEKTSLYVRYDTKHTFILYSHSLTYASVWVFSVRPLGGNWGNRAFGCHIFLAGNQQSNRGVARLLCLPNETRHSHCVIFCCRDFAILNETATRQNLSHTQKSSVTPTVFSCTSLQRPRLNSMELLKQSPNPQDQELKIRRLFHYQVNSFSSPRFGGAMGGHCS